MYGRQAKREVHGYLPEDTRRMDLEKLYAVEESAKTRSVPTPVPVLVHLHIHMEQRNRFHRRSIPGHAAHTPSHHSNLHEPGHAAERLTGWTRARPRDADRGDTCAHRD